MFRLIKLALYAAIGYALYELYLGMTQQYQQGGGGGQWGGAGSGRSSFGDSLEVGSPRAQNLSGAGEGTDVATGDASGTSVTHRVGRGVTM
jgi:hypothetical protein